MISRTISYISLTLVLMAISSTCLIAIEKNNHDRWETPTNEGPDKDVPGYLINLGPTGARAILESKSFIVSISSKTPLPMVNCK